VRALSRSAPSSYPELVSKLLVRDDVAIGEGGPSFLHSGSLIVRFPFVIQGSSGQRAQEKIARNVEILKKPLRGADLTLGKTVDKLMKVCSRTHR
jgi:hypothetical protein